MSGDDGLREALADWFAGGHSTCGWDREMADAVLALPEVAALRAKAAAADRVRELMRKLDSGKADIPTTLHAIRRALDGEPKC